jgi:predicted DNA-binding transcriptional regulator
MKNYHKKKEGGYKAGYFFTLPNEVFEQGFTVYELVVYAFLVRAKDKVSDQSYWSVKNIARHCNMCENTCRKALHSLEEQGFISISKRFRDRVQQSNLYTVYEI